MVLRLWAKAHSAASPFLQLHPEAEPEDQAGRLNPARRAPLGPNAGEILPPSQIWTSNVAWHQLLDLPVQHALHNDVDTQAPPTHACTLTHTHRHTILSCRQQGLEGYAAQFLPFFLFRGSSSILAEAGLDLSCQLLPSCWLSLTFTFLLSFQLPCVLFCLSVFISLSLCLACQALNI